LDLTGFRPEKREKNAPSLTGEAGKVTITGQDTTTKHKCSGLKLDLITGDSTRTAADVHIFLAFRPFKVMIGYGDGWLLDS
jgi:hypothetical protein